MVKDSRASNYMSQGKGDPAETDIELGAFIRGQNPYAGKHVSKIK